MNSSTFNFAYYRLPGHTRYTYVAQNSGTPRAFESVARLNGCRGFVLAPFVCTPDCPVWLVEPDVREEYPVEPDDQAVGPQLQASPFPEQSSTYASDFRRFHERLTDGSFDKLVLSTCAPLPGVTPADALQLFMHACRSYPRLFVALVSTEQAGMWLMATPEVLLEGSGSHWQTMALAGTMQAMGEIDLEQVEWSEKNRAEQQCVGRYIADLLQQHASDVTHRGPYTTRAAHLLHLRTDFQFTLADTMRLGDLLEGLHPTPAVCGMPKKEAREFIVAQESHRRKYYSGFCGPIDPMGDTRLYVSLRCMEIGAKGCTLYAGGGLLKDSVMESEWKEVQSKMQTMRRLLSL